jgi:outer membrane protein
MMAFASNAQAQSLVEMYEAARGYDAGFISAKAQFEANLARANQALGGILPNIAVSVNHSKSDVQRQIFGTDAVRQDIAALETKTTAASLVQPIYRPAAWASYRQGGRQLQQAAAQYEASEHDLLIRVSQAYFEVLTSEDNYELMQNQKKAVSEQLASAQRNFEVGTATITGVRDAQARYDLANAQAIAAENDLRTKRLALNMVVGLNDAKPKRLAKHSATIAAPKDDVNVWVNQAQASSPTVRQAQLAVEVADFEIDKAMASHKPTLDAQVTYGRTENLKGTAVPAISNPSASC